MNAPFSIGRGFKDPVIGPQIVFRTVLDALARPGRPVAIEPGGAEGPAILPAGVLAILLTLCDYETPVWMDASLHDGGLKAWLSFHCGAPLAREPEDAAFALLCNSAGSQSLASFAQGDDRYPDRSATVVVLCDSFTGGTSWALSGPGIKHQENVAPLGLPPDFLAQAQANHAKFPRGVDLLLVSPEGLIGLPRSTRLVTMERN
jgi:alpha-D-ribose 1-methylphosphonate 5-triphosphate synthase subunit PhnH